MIKFKPLVPLSVFAFVFFSCTQQKQINSPDELGKTIFEYFKKQEKKKIISYIISRDEIRLAFKNSTEFNLLNEESKNEFVSSTYERNKKDAISFIDFYTNSDYDETIALKSGQFIDVISEEKDERGTKIAGIKVTFNSAGKKYALILRAAKVDSYWKLLHWIEVRAQRQG